MSRDKGFRWLRIGLGVLLLLTAGLKAFGGSLDPSGPIPALSNPIIQFAVIELEVILAVWLLSGWQVAGAWLTSLLAFGTFLVFNLYLGVVGHASCGCLGRIQVNPYVTAGFDLAIMVALLVFRPARLSWYNSASILNLARKLAGAIAMLAVVLGVGSLVLGSPQDLIALFRGEAVSVHPETIDLGSGVAESRREANVTICNRSEDSVRLIGGTVDCACSVVKDLPVMLGPGESRSITVSFLRPDKEGRFVHHPVIWTDSPRQRTLLLRIIGGVNKSKIKTK